VAATRPVDTCPGRMNLVLPLRVFEITYQSYLNRMMTGKLLKFPQFLGPFCFLNVICGSGGAPIRREQVGKAPS